VLVSEQSPAAFARAIARFETLEISPVACREHAESFSEERFTRALQAIVWSVYAAENLALTRA